MGNRLTKREQGFIKDIARGSTDIQAVKNNFNITKTNSASAYAHKLKQKPKVVKRLLSIADQIPDKLLVEKHLELLNVPKKVRTILKGELVNEYEEIDSNAVGKGLDMAYKIKGTYAPEKKEVLLDGRINVDNQKLEIAKKYEEEIKKEL